MIVKFPINFVLLCVIIGMSSLTIASVSEGVEADCSTCSKPENRDFSIWSVVNKGPEDNGDRDNIHLSSAISFSNNGLESIKDERIWGGIFLAVGFSSTLYGYLSRDIYYSSKNITRTFVDDDGTFHELTFTLYTKRHANAQTALLSSIGLFCNGSYWMLKDHVNGVDLEEYSPLFSERNMAWYSIAFGTLITSAAFLIPEYNDKVRRGYEKSTETSGRVFTSPIQDESREYSYRQTAVNVGVGMIYTLFGVYKLMTTDNNSVKSAPVQGCHREWTFSLIPTIEPAGAILTVRF